MILMEVKEVKTMALVVAPPVHETDFGGQVWFSEWRQTNGYPTYRRMREDMLEFEGATDDEVFERWCEMEAEFVDYCQENGYDWVMDE